MEASLAPSSRLHYERAWKKLVAFHESLFLTTCMPVSMPMMLLFIAHLHATGSAPASIVSTVSAIAYFHKINGFADPSNCFLVAKLLAGARNLGAVPDVRLPVTLPVLARLIQALPTVFSSHYKCLMLRAMMVLAFKAYLRIGEMVPRARNMVHGCLHMGDVLLSGELIMLSFRRFKHSARQGPQSLQVRGECIHGSAIHPAAFLREFQQARGALPGPLFAHPDGSPMLRREFDGSLKTLLVFCGYETSAFKGHSFRIGAATAAALRGESDAQIRAAGRWTSDAFKKYIRIA
ncbi:hypothetical protein DJ031_00315 [bacterium endosymbiont of Escarpia laminata]|nr:MAG: hypothetical protein DJ031_00315 [bacterium endosymbiont of Escarpia laminata]